MVCGLQPDRAMRPLLVLVFVAVAVPSVGAHADPWIGGEVGGHFHAVHGNSAIGAVARITAGVDRGPVDLAAAIGADWTYHIDEGSGHAAVAAVEAGVHVWSRRRVGVRVGLGVEGRRSTFHVDKDDLDDSSSDLALVPALEATLTRGRWRFGLALRERIAVYDSFYGWWPGVLAMTYGDLPGESVTVTFRRAL